MVVGVGVLGVDVVVVGVGVVGGVQCGTVTVTLSAAVELPFGQAVLTVTR